MKTTLIKWFKKVKRTFSTTNFLKRGIKGFKTAGKWVKANKMLVASTALTGITGSALAWWFNRKADQVDQAGFSGDSGEHDFQNVPVARQYSKEYRTFLTSAMRIFETEKHITEKGYAELATLIRNFHILIENVSVADPAVKAGFLNMYRRLAAVGVTTLEPSSDPYLMRSVLDEETSDITAEELSDGICQVITQDQSGTILRNI